MNIGWYLVYLFAIFINSFLSSHEGFYLNDWQYWVYLGTCIFSFLAGSYYRN